MGSLLVVTGPPGAGKSTVAGTIVDRLDPSALVEGDEFFRFLRNGAVEPWLPAAHAQNTTVVRAHAASAASFRDAGYQVVVDGVVGPWLLDVFIEYAAGPIDYAVLLPPLDVCLDRIATRAGHRFADPEATTTLHEQFADAVDALPESHVFDTVLPPGELADQISDRRAAGALISRPHLRDFRSADEIIGYDENGLPT